MLRYFARLLSRLSAAEGSAVPHTRKRSRTAAAMLFLVSMVGYVSHPMSWESADSVTTKLIPVLVLTKGTLRFDDYIPALEKRYPEMGDFLYFVRKTPNGYISFFPIAPGILLAPFLSPFILWKSLDNPPPEEWIDFTDRQERILAALLTSGCVVGLFFVLTQLGAGISAAMMLSLIFAFASNAFCTFSQQLFQHGFSTLLSLIALYASLRELNTPRKWPFLFVGVAAGLAVACRPSIFVFLCAIAAWIALTRPRVLAYVIVGAAIPVIPVVVYNLTAHENLFGGYYVNAPAPEPSLSKTGVLAAMLLSPSKGLFFFFPVGLLSLAGLWSAARRRAENLALYSSLLSFCVAYVILIWWIRWDGDWYGGHCFGPRYMSDVQFAMVILMVPLLRSPVGPALRATFIILSLCSFAMQCVGVYVIQGDPNFRAANVWSFRDSPLGRVMMTPTLPGAQPGNLRYPSLPQEPARLSAGNPVQEMISDGETALFVHAPSEIVLSVDGRNGITGTFGIFPQAYENGGHTDGVEFVVDFVKTDGNRQTLFHRYLQPVSEPKDRGRQSFSINLSGLSGDLVLMTRCGPQYEGNWDWSYWSRVRFR